MTEIEQTLKDSVSSYDMTVRSDDPSSSSEIPLTVYLVALGIILVVLLISCGSYFEPVLFLVTIGIAVVLNRGTGFL